MQKTSERGIQELMAHEGVVQSPYLDSVGNFTVGIGHTANAGLPDPGAEWRVYPLPEVLEIFKRDLGKFERRVRNAFTVPLAQEQFDAAVSFDFNTGRIHNASWVRRYNDDDWSGAAQAFMNYRKPPEIIPRREKERDLFFDGRYSSNGLIPVYPSTEQGQVLWNSGRQVPFSDIWGGKASVAVPKPKPKVPKSVGIGAAFLALGTAIWQFFDSIVAWFERIF